MKAPSPFRGTPAPPVLPKFLQGEARNHYRKTAKKLARIGLLVKSPNGLPVLSPYLIAANQALKKVRSLLA